MASLFDTLNQDNLKELEKVDPTIYKDKSPSLTEALNKPQQGATQGSSSRGATGSWDDSAGAGQGGATGSWEPDEAPAAKANDVDLTPDEKPITIAPTKQAKEKAIQIIQTVQNDTKTIEDYVKQNQDIMAKVPDFQKEFEELKKSKDLALAAYKSEKDDIKWSGIYEKLGQAFAQLGAGMYGLKSGLNMSGLQFDKTDWTDAYKAAKDELDMKLGLLNEQGQALKETRTELKDKAAQEAGMVFSLGRDAQKRAETLSDNAVNRQHQLEMLNKQLAAQSAKSPTGPSKLEIIKYQAQMRGMGAKAQAESKIIQASLKETIDKERGSAGSLK